MTDPNDATTLTESAAIVERMVHARLQIISEGPTPELPALSKYIDMIARLTAIRKSLATLKSNPCNASPNPQSSLVNRQFPPISQSSPNPQPSIVNRQSVHQVHQIRSIPAMPVERIASELDAITKELEFAGAESSDTAQISHECSESTPPAAASIPAPARAPNPAARPFKFRKKRKRR